jgi:hypothetical protein
MTVGDLRSSLQLAVNAFAVVVSIVVLAAASDLRHILLPPPSPAVVGPSSPSPYELWVSLDTSEPETFYVVLESGFWSNRRSEVARYPGENASTRAQIRLSRLMRQTTHDPEEGTVWIERRQRFLTREFAPGERVGRYSFSYLNRLGRD